MSRDIEPCGCNCQQVEQELFELLDAHRPPEDCAKIRAHIQECYECGTRLQVEEAVRALLHECCAPPPAPVTLRSQITMQIRVWEN